MTAAALRRFDLWLFHLGNATGAGRAGDAFFVWLTDPPHRVLVFLVLAAALAVFGGDKGRRTLIWMACVLALTDQAASNLLKPWLDRVRPCFSLPETRLLLPGQSGSPSFPSNHAANSFAAAVLLFRVHPVLGVIGLIVAALVAFSRVYVGVHYPSDLLGGALLGVGCALGAQALVRWAGRLLRER